MFQAGYFLWINKVQPTFYFQDQELTAIEIKTTILLTSFKIAMSLLKVVKLQFELNVYKVMCNWRHSHDASRQIIS